MTDDKAQPIRDEHQAFARDLVALARQHGANHLRVEFALTGGRRLFEEQYDPTRVRFDWQQGRHGARSRFGLRAEAHISVEEAQG